MLPQLSHSSLKNPQPLRRSPDAVYQLSPLFSERPSDSTRYLNTVLEDETSHLSNLQTSGEMILPELSHRISDMDIDPKSANKPN